MMKVVMYTDNPVIPTGYASTSRLTCKELMGRAVHAFATCFNGGDQPDGIQQWCGINLIPNSAVRRDPSRIYGDAEMVMEIQDKVKPDAWIFHNDSYRYSYFAELPETIRRRSLFWLPFEGSQPDLHGFERVFGQAAMTAFVTTHAAKLHEPLMMGKEWVIIPHAIEQAYRPPTPEERTSARAKRGVAGKFVVTRVDRNQPRKHWRQTLEAFSIFAKGKDDVVMLAKCNPRDMAMGAEDLEKDAEALGIKDKIRFDDFFFRPDEMPHAFYWPADACLSTTSGEGFGLGLVEAAGCGLPVVCPEVKVLPEVLGPTAMLCKTKGSVWNEGLKQSYPMTDVDDAASKLEELYRQPRLEGGIPWAQDRGGWILNRYNPRYVYDQMWAMLKLLADKDCMPQRASRPA
jgi:glycosyltransferase involved in cell wall biosynthesis